jgi:hypothetical protein
MKTSYKISFAAILWLAVSCLNEKDLKVKDPMSSSGIVLNIGIDITVKDASKRSLGVNIDNFRIDIYKPDGSIYLTFNRLADVPDTIPLAPGNYYIEANSGTLLPGGFDCPFYSGKSEIITVNPEEIKTTSVLCTMSNCKLTVVYSQRIKDSFSNYRTVINNSDTSVTLNMGENRAAYFSLKPITITAVLEYIKQDGSTGSKQMTGKINNPEKQKHYELHIDAGLSQPQVTLNVQVDESETMEIVNLTENNGSSPTALIGYGKVLITEIMYDPASMSDTHGEWFELYNSSPDTIDMFHLVLKRGSSNSHIINSHILLKPGNFIAMVKTDSACAVTNKYVYGSSISLPNTGDELSISNYGTNGSDGDVISSVFYGTSHGFPNGAGASISLDNQHFQVDQAKIGSNWCVSTSIYNKSDKGTPGLSNDSCN